MDHQMNKQEAFQDWSRRSLLMHEQGLRNLQDWFFALALVCEVAPDKLAKALHDTGPLYGFGQNFQLRMKEETDRRIKEEKEKLKTTAVEKEAKKK